MSKKVAAEIMAGLREAIDYVRGRRVKGLRVWEIPPGAIKAARQRLALSQADFADRFGFSVRNLQKWEQGAARPSGAARAFLTVIAREPRAVMRALKTARPAGRLATARIARRPAAPTKRRKRMH